MDTFEQDTNIVEVTGWKLQDNASAASTRAGQENLSPR
jgi:hypothetical protein